MQTPQQLHIVIFGTIIYVLHNSVKIKDFNIISNLQKLLQ